MGVNTRKPAVGRTVRRASPVHQEDDRHIEEGVIRLGLVPNRRARRAIERNRRKGR